MNPVVLLLADGHAFFLGMAIVAGAVLVSRWVEHRALRSFLRIIEILGVGFVIASSTPLPVWVYCAWAGIWLAGFLVPRLRTSWIVTSVFLLCSGALFAWEFPHHIIRRIDVRRGQHIYVVGDSLSAGLGGPERTWPSVLADYSHIAVTNLAVAGATASSALEQTAGITDPGSLVFVEIGGNDLFAGASELQFSTDLDALLAKIPGSCSVAMFELPLYPMDNRFGVVQRTLAARHHVLLIPKEVLTEAIGGRNDTIDGLHLSQKGHDTLATLVYGDLLITP